MTASPMYALFRHLDGSWYRLWITRTEPKTERGHAWHLHATYDKTGTLAPVAGTLWYEQPYGMSDWDFDSKEEACAAFRERAQERLAHGYQLREGQIPEPPETDLGNAPAPPTVQRLTAQRKRSNKN